MSTASTGTDTGETPSVYSAHHGLDVELAAVTADIGRTDSKASLILTMGTVLIAGIALLGKMPPVALALAAIGTAAMVGSAILSILVVMPRLDKTRSNSFTRWADLEAHQILDAVATDQRPHRLRELSRLCERKMTYLVWASRLSLVSIVSTSAAAILTAAA